MSVTSIRLFGDPVLRTPAIEVTTFDAELRKLVADLTDTMHDEGGAGLAAPQIGIGLRVFAYDVDGVAGHLVNPTFDTVGEEEQLGPEGCLSIPGMTWDCRRHLHVVARGFDMHGEPITIEGSESLARCVQHETDHLDGVLFVDRLDPETRKQAMAQIRAAPWFGSSPSPGGSNSLSRGGGNSLSPGGGHSLSPGGSNSLSPGSGRPGPIVKVSPHPLLGKAR